MIYNPGEEVYYDKQIWIILESNPESQSHLLWHATNLNQWVKEIYISKPPSKGALLNRIAELEYELNKPTPIIAAEREICENPHCGMKASWEIKDGNEHVAYVCTMCYEAIKLIPNSDAVEHYRIYNEADQHR